MSTKKRPRSGGDRAPSKKAHVSVPPRLQACAEAALAAADEFDFDALEQPLRDAYGDVVEAPDEIAELRAVSFAAWRALRPPRGGARAEDVLWAFGTRSTEDRLRRARDLLMARREALEAAAASGGE